MEDNGIAMFNKCNMASLSHDVEGFLIKAQDCGLKTNVQVTLRAIMVTMITWSL